jgi:hypothetical protein
MTRNRDFRRQFVSRMNGLIKDQARPLKREHNHPVPLDEFDREGMGLAAKE